MKTTKPITIFLAIFAIAVQFVQTATAAELNALKATIENYGSGTPGKLTTAIVGNNTIIVRGTKDGVNTILKLDISPGIKVLWRASIKANTPNEFIFKEGAGVFEMDSGYIKNDNANATYSAIKVAGGDLIFSRGYIYASRGYGIMNSSTGTLTITGGEIFVEGSTSVAVYNNSTGAVNIKGGTVSGTYYGVYNSSTGTVNISGGKIETKSGKAVYNFSSGGTVNITGGEISATRGTAINSASKINISAPARITSK